MNTDFRVVHFDIVDHGAQIGSAERNSPLQHIGAHDFDGGRDLVLGDPRVRPQLRERTIMGDLCNVALGLHRRDPVFQRGIARIGNAVLDRLIEALQPFAGIIELVLERPHSLPMIFIARGLALHQSRKQLLNMAGRQELIGQPVGDDRIELVHRDRPALASRLALLRTGGAGIVAIAPRLAGAQRHAAAAARTGGNARQQDRAGDGARRRGFRIAGFELRLNRIEGRRVDDRIDRHHNLFGFRLGLSGLPDLRVEAVFALIGGAGNQLVQRTDAPSRSTPRAIAMIIQPSRDSLDTHRAGRAIPFTDQLEHLPHDFGLDRIDGELLFRLRAALFGGDDGIAVGSSRAVPEALPGVFLHGAQDVLGVFLGLVFIEQREDLPHHDAHGIVAKVLRNRNQPDIVLAELAHMIFEREVIAREAAERMHHDRIERRAAARGDIEQPLKLRALVIGAGQARIDKLRHHVPAARLAEGYRLPALIGYRQIAFGLPSGGNAQVKSSALRRFIVSIGKRCSLMTSHCSYSENVPLVPPRL